MARLECMLCSVEFDGSILRDKCPSCNLNTALRDITEWKCIACQYKQRLKFKECPQCSDRNIEVMEYA